MTKIGILGGIFDPVHIGHLHIADGILRKLGLSKIYFVPAGAPPHKIMSPYASGEHRLEMLHIALNNNPAFDILDIEIKRPGKSYSVDTLIALRDERPDWKLYFIIGGDNLTEINSWKNPVMIFKLSHVVLVNRPDSIKQLHEVTLPGDVTEVYLPGLNISSTEIRKYIRDRTPCKYLLPAGVEEYILKNRIYK
jgi:nicotinate-nucleotide adenylyltransferase